jgi:Putative prokaryotic signal transducing protein
MKQVFALPESAELELLKTMLEEAGVRCALRNEQLSQALPAMPFNVELWVANDDDFPRAQELCQAWLHPPPDAMGTWVCAQCGQRLRSQFDSCWKCGAERQTTTTFNNEGKDNENVSRFVD